MDVSPEALGLSIAVAALAGPAVFFMGRVRGDLDNLRRDVENLKSKAERLQVDYGILTAAVMKHDVPPERTRSTSEAP